MAASSDSDPRLGLMERAFGAFNSGDVDAFVPLLAPGVVSHVASGLANAGNWKGEDGFMAMLRNWVEPWGVIKMVPSEPEFLGGPQVLVRVDQSAEGAGSGVPVELTVHMALEIDSERVYAVGIFPEREVALAWLAERQSGRAVSG